MVAVRLEGLTKEFGRNVAVDHVNLEIEDKSFVTLLGPSGCGKTTTLRMIAGLEAPTDGEVYFDGEPVTDIPPHKRNVAMVFQDYALYPHMTAYDNIAFNLRMKKVPEDEIRDQIKNTTELLRVGHLLKRLPTELSGGEKQRVALGRALVRKPAIFLLDEPLSNIDAQLREEMRSELIKIHEEFQTTFIYVTHDQIEALTLSSKVALMNLGRMVQYDSPMDLYNKPADTFVASFLGSPSINLLQGKIVRDRDSDSMLFKGEDLIYPIPGSLKLSEDKVGTRVSLGIRPEDISVSKATKTEEISTNVYTRELRGAETILSVKFGDTLAKVRVEAESRFQAGDRIAIKFKKWYLFDKKSRLLVIWQS